VAEYAQCLPIDLLGAGATGDGSRVAIWAAPIGRLGVHLRSAGQAWTGAATGLQAMSPAGGWFDGTGRLHLLVRTTGSSGVGGAVPWAAYVER
jgi:hypothetical protein